MSARRDRHRARTRAWWAPAVLLSALLVVSACSSSKSSTPNDVATVTPASASAAPTSSNPAGTVISAPDGSGGSAMAISGDRLGVAAANGRLVRWINRAAVQAPPTSTSLSAPITVLVGVGGGAFLGAGPDVIARFDAAGKVVTAPLPSRSPTSLARTADGSIVVGTADGHVLVFDADFKQLHDFASFVRVDAITVSPAGADLDDEQVVVLDRAQSSVTPITLSDGNLGPALRAGNGATNSTVDRFGRVLVANTRDNEIVGFFGSPLVMRFRYPVADGPYAVDYDDHDNLLWVSTTGNNEAVAFDLGSGEPREKYRFATVSQPDSLVVDDVSGTVYVLSARSGDVQVVRPGESTPVSSAVTGSSPAPSSAPTSTVPATP